MDFTGERLVLGKKGIEQLEMEHLHRYNCILDLVKDKIVLDIACGTGYGSSMLAGKAKYVYGVDISKETIDYCNDKYTKNNLEYFQGSVANVDLEDNSVDVIVSFETIEHVEGELQVQFLSEIKRVLKSDGILIMSTPDKKIYSDIPKYKNEFHVKEFYKEEFKGFLCEAFSNVKFFNQGLQICDLITDESKKISKQIMVKDSADESLYPYLIAVCSNRNIDDISLNSFVVDKDNSLFLMNRKFDDFNRSLNGDEILTNQKNIIEQKENYIEEQRQKLEGLNCIVEQKEDYIQEQRSELEERRIVIEQKQNYIEEQRSEIEEQRKELEEHRSELEEKRVIIEQKENYINEQREKLKEKDSFINEQRNELNEIKNSKYYKVYEKVKSILGRKS